MAISTAVPTAPATARVPDYVARFPMTYEAFLAWDSEGGLAEWVDGEAYLYTTATELHQRIVGLLFVSLPPA